MSNPTTTPTTNDEAVSVLERQYPARDWSCTTLVGDYPELLTVTFQRYTDDAEDRYVVQNGNATLI